MAEVLRVKRHTVGNQPDEAECDDRQGEQQCLSCRGAQQAAAAAPRRSTPLRAG